MSEKIIINRKTHNQVVIGANKALFIITLENLLALFIIYVPLINYVKILLSVLYIFIIPAIPLILLFVKSKVDLGKLLLLSLTISPILIEAICLLLSSTFPPLNRIIFITVIATNVGGISEAVINGVNGYLVPPRDSESLAKAIISSIENPEKMRKIVLEGRRILEQKFSMYVITSKLSMVLSERSSISDFPVS